MEDQELINWVNIILPLIPVDPISQQPSKPFTIDDILDNFPPDFSRDKEIADFLLQHRFANHADQISPLSRPGRESRPLTLTRTGIELRMARSYQGYMQERIEKVESVQAQQVNLTEKLTSVVAVWTFIAGLYYESELLKTYIPYSAPYRKEIIYFLMFASFVVGIIWIKKILAGKASQQ